ncbi:peptidase M20/M25/M40 family protein [Striga asiatica]|uniref:Peptidase M20/M25/M40 family protein n=1 Tax=Striga asiatica TaxID=4170 RepID=A0A5A7PQP4_STRAF|nr:peptidase M20/M25/M40 family protein [Striga asiatica]
MISCQEYDVAVLAVEDLEEYDSVTHLKTCEDTGSRLLARIPAACSTFVRTRGQRLRRLSCGPSTPRICSNVDEQDSFVWGARTAAAHGSFSASERQQAGTAHSPTVKADGEGLMAAERRVAGYRTVGLPLFGYSPGVDEPRLSLLFPTGSQTACCVTGEDLKGWDEAARTGG